MRVNTCWTGINRLSLRASHSWLSLAAHVDVARPHPPAAPARHSGTQSAALGNELLTGLPELSDPPAVDDGVEDRLQVAEPQGSYADWVEDRAVVEPPAEHRQQADHCVRQPAHGETDEEDENGGEGSGLEAHVHLDLRGPLQAGKSHFADLVECWQAGMLTGVVVDAQGVAAHGVEDAHVRVKHDGKRYEEHRNRQQHRVAAVRQGVAVTQHALRRPGGPHARCACPPPDYRRQRHAEAQHPRTGDQQLRPVRGQLVLPLHNDEETVHTDYEEYGHPLQDEQPVQHDGGSAEAASEAPVGSGHGDRGEGHAEQGKHNVRKGQRGEEEIDSRTHGRFLVNNQTHDCVAEETDRDHEDHDGGQGHAQSDRYEGSSSLWRDAVRCFFHHLRPHESARLLQQAFIAKSHRGYF